MAIYGYTDRFYAGDFESSDSRKILVLAKHHNKPWILRVTFDVHSVSRRLDVWKTSDFERKVNAGEI